jgi:hypothetical protein
MNPAGATVEPDARGELFTVRCSTCRWFATIVRRRDVAATAQHHLDVHAQDPVPSEVEA